MKTHYDTKYFNYQDKIASFGMNINRGRYDKFIALDDVVLDFGCGSARTLSTINCAKKIGIEINDSCIKEALENKRVDEMHKNILSISSDSVDVVISNHALEHVERPLDVLKECLRVLKPRGKIIFYLPYNDYRETKKFNEDDKNMHLYTWNIQLIGNLFKVAGFDNIKARMHVHAWPKKYEWYYANLPLKIWDFVCFLTAIKKHRRQVIITASKPYLTI